MANKTLTSYGNKKNPDAIKLLTRKGIKVEVVDSRIKLRRKTIAPVYSMYNRGALTMAQFSAGKRLYEHYGCAWGESSNYEPRERVDGGSKSQEVTTSQIHAMKQLEKAEKAAKKDWNLIKEICIDEKTLTKQGMGEHERRKRLYAFRRGLNRVAEVFGYK